MWGELYYYNLRSYAMKVVAVKSRKETNLIRYLGQCLYRASRQSDRPGKGTCGRKKR